MVAGIFQGAYRRAMTNDNKQQNWFMLKAKYFG